MFSCLGWSSIRISVLLSQYPSVLFQISSECSLSPILQHPSNAYKNYIYIPVYLATLVYNDNTHVKLLFDSLAMWIIPWDLEYFVFRFTRLYCLFHLFVSTNNTCVLLVLFISIHPLRRSFYETFIRAFKHIFSSLFHIYIFHSINYSACVIHMLVHLILVWIQTTGSDETPSSYPHYPRPSAKTWYVFIIPNKFLGYVLSIVMCIPQSS